MNHHISSVTVVVEIDGRTCVAPIRPDAAQLFVGMLPAFQREREGQKGAWLVGLPPDVVAHLTSAGEALAAHIKKSKENPHD